MIICSGIGAIILVIFVFFLILKSVTGEKLHLTETAEIIVAENKILTEQSERLNKWSSQFSEEIGHLDVLNQNILERNGDAKLFVQYFLGSLLLNDTQLFSSYFDFETLFLSISNIEPQDRPATLEKFINFIKYKS